MIRKTIAIAAIVSIFLAAGAFFLLNKSEKDTSFNYDPGEYFVTDIKDSTRLLKTDIIIHSASDEDKENWEAENHRIRDIIIYIFRTKTYEELQDEKIFVNLNEEIIEALNKEFETKAFKRIYFNEFVIQ